jgi:actin-related protein
MVHYTDCILLTVVCGGSTLFRGFGEGLRKKLGSLHIQGPDATVVVPAERGRSAYVGALIMSELDSLERGWFTKAEYEEHGAEYVHRKGYA